MIQTDNKNKDDKSIVQPDPETLGPEPQEHMEGPISSLVKKVAHTMDENDQDVEIDGENDSEKKKKDDE